jgi:alanine racemase
VSPAMLCAVVKADGYGHGAVPCAKAAISSGATWLGVATVEEAIDLREAGIGAPILLLSEFPDTAVEHVVKNHITPTVYSEHKISMLATEAHRQNEIVGVHFKVDTGMHRVGAQPHETLGLIRAILAHPSLMLCGVFTHFAVADSPLNKFTDLQLQRFDAVLAELRAENVDPGIVHASNSAGTIAHVLARYDMVRVGVSLFGNDPDHELSARTYGVELQPILTLRTAISHVKVVSAGERISYGLTYEFSEDSVVATIPIGYADGVARRLSEVGGEVLIHGRRFPMVGRITMDQIMINCGPPNADDPVVTGDVVVLIGAQGSERIEPSEVAHKLSTISYEVTCAISKRVPRTYVGSA